MERKYRAWHKELKRYFEVKNIYFESKCIDVEYLSKGFYSEFTFDEVILEQETGLKDMNGKSIYEGDIVGHKNSVGLVVFYHGSFDFSQSLRGTLYTNLFHMWVMGNINENEKLLQ